MDMDPAELGGVEWVSEFCPVKGSSRQSLEAMLKSQLHWDLNRRPYASNAGALPIEIIRLIAITTAARRTHKYETAIRGSRRAENRRH